MLGQYDPKTYDRGRILHKGLLLNGVHSDLFTSKNLLRIAGRMCRRDFDILLVTGKPVLLTAWLLKLWHRKPIVFDTFISDYDNLVIDRKKVSQGSLKAKLLWWGDRLACKLATHNILDTNQHIKYFVQEFGLSKSKFSRVFVGADEDVFKPMPSRHKGFRVAFHGTYIPLQGIEFILQAAKLLEREKITFELVGNGQTFPEMQTLANKLQLHNVTFTGFLPLEQLPGKIAAGDLNLGGHFGTTPKALRVIPNKAFQIIAMRHPLIAGDTPAAKELFVHGENAFFCPTGNADALAASIRELKKNRKLAKHIADNGYRTFLASASNRQIGKSVKYVLKKLSGLS